MNDRRKRRSKSDRCEYKKEQKELKRQQKLLSILYAKMCNPQQQQNEQKDEEKQEQQQQQDQEYPNVSINASPPCSPPTCPTAEYALFLYREELRRHNANSSRASKTKIMLTNELIARTKKNINNCSSEDLSILARETIFKKKLQRSLHYRRQQLKHEMLDKQKINEKVDKTSE